jgi:hypothetical protein
MAEKPSARWSSESSDEDIQTIARRRQPHSAGPARSFATTKTACLWAAHAGPSAVAPPVDFVARMVAAVFQGSGRPPALDTIVDARAEGDVMTAQVDEHRWLPGALSLTCSCPPSISCRRRGPSAGAVRGRTGTRTRSRKRGQGQTGWMLRRCRPRRPRRPGSRQSRRRPGLPRDRCPARSLILERTSRSVRPRPAGAARIGRAGLGAFLCLGLAFAMLIVSPRGFRARAGWRAAAVAWVGFLAMAWSRRLRAGAGRCPSPATTPTGGREDSLRAGIFSRGPHPHGLFSARFARGLLSDDSPVSERFQLLTQLPASTIRFAAAARSRRRVVAVPEGAAAASRC